MKDNSGKIMLALLAGASAGVIAGLLMAPDSGLATRDSLKKSASKLGKDLEKKLKDGMSKLEEMNAGSLLTSASSLMGMGKGENGGSQDSSGMSGSAKGSSTSSGTASSAGSTSGGSTGSATGSAGMSGGSSSTGGANSGASGGTGNKM